jgi:gliding motility-associated-like protein
MVGLDFNSGAPVVLKNSKMDTREGCSSVSDKDGNLLFYTDGITVWNKNHAEMSNGTGLLGNSSSTQSSVVVKKPGSDNLYYIFNPDCSESATGGLHYSIVDMDKKGGLGEVIEKNTVLLAGRITEKIVTIKSDAGCGFWIVTHSLTTNEFYSYLLSISGISTTPVKSYTNIYHTDNDMLGYLKASPDGKKIASCSYSAMRVALFGFNNATGEVLGGEVLDSGYLTYGCSFSPNSNLLYIGSFSKLDLYQYDVSLSSLSAIKASKKTIYSSFSVFVFGALQLGPDKKIYITKEGASYLGVINNPDVKGLGCNYKDSGLLIGVGPRLGLPNFIDNPNPFSAALSLGPDKKYCINSTFTIGPVLPITGSVLWSTGDTTPTITQSQPGTYWIKADVACGSVIKTLIDTIEVIAVADTLPLYLGNDTALCGTSLLTIGVSPQQGVDYVWSTGQTTPSISVNTSNKYWLKATSACGQKSDTMFVSIDTVVIKPIFLGNDTSVCNTTMALTTGLPNYVKHLWSTGATTATINVDTSGTYWVRAGNSCKTEADTIKIALNNILPVYLGNDTTTCEDFRILTPKNQQNKAHYLWSTGDTVPTTKVTATGNYKLTISNSCGTEADSVYITFIKDISSINIGNDTVICSGQIELSAPKIQGAKYKWSTGDTSPTTTVAIDGNYKLQVVTVCNNTFEDSLQVGYYQTKPLKLTDDIVACSESFTQAILSTPHPYKSYLWNTGSQTPQITITQPDTYILTVTDSCQAVFTDTVTLTICNCQLLVPNAFTPNNDGLNDVFMVNTECIPQKYAIKIYSRWGSLVYESKDLLTGWDGTYKGAQVPEGVYFVVIDYYYATSHKKPFYSGSVTVLR